MLQWYHDELRGHGDLRLYASVQLYSALVLPIALLLKPRYSRNFDFAVVLEFDCGMEMGLGAASDADEPESQSLIRACRGSGLGLGA